MTNNTTLAPGFKMVCAKCGHDHFVTAPVPDHFCGWPEGSEQCRMWHHAGTAAPIYRPGDKKP